MQFICACTGDVRIESGSGTDRVVVNIGLVVLRSNGAHLSSAEITQLLQCAMFVAGIGTCLQLYPIGVIGSGLPIIMGVSLRFLEVCW